MSATLTPVDVLTFTTERDHGIPLQNAIEDAQANLENRGRLDGPATDDSQVDEIRMLVAIVAGLITPWSLTFTQIPLSPDDRAWFRTVTR